MKKLANSEELRESTGYGDGGDQSQSHKTLSPITPPPSLLGKLKKMRVQSSKIIKKPTLASKLIKGKQKKKLEEMLVTSCDQSSKNIKKLTVSPKLINVSSGQASKSASSGPVNSAMVRAEKVVSGFDPNIPTFLKTMVRSHVSSCFWMGLPSQYCKSYLPKKDMMLTVEDENGKEFQMKYFYERTGLSGGWRNFAIAQKLLEDDVVIFQLVNPLEPVKFKVYIVRANDAAKEDDEHKQQEDDAGKGSSKIGHKPLAKHATKRKCLKPPRRDAVQKKKEIGHGKSVSKMLHFADESEKDNDENDVEIISSRSFSPQIQFKDVKSFENFTIMVDGVCIDSELPGHIRQRYYELCSVKKAFLHARVMQGLNSKLIAGIICETVNIADSLKTCSLTTCRGEFANWERALKSFHFMGMSVGFIIARIRKIVALAFESEEAVECRKYMEAKLERIRAEDEIVNLKHKFSQLEETYKKCGGDVKALKPKAKGYEHKFQEEVDAPW